MNEFLSMYNSIRGKLDGTTPPSPAKAGPQSLKDSLAGKALTKNVRLAGGLPVFPLREDVMQSADTVVDRAEQHAGSDRAGSGKPGSDVAGSGKPGSDRAGSKPGSDRAGSGKPGSDKKEEDCESRTLGTDGEKTYFLKTTKPGEDSEKPVALAVEDAEEKEVLTAKELETEPGDLLGFILAAVPKLKLTLVSFGLLEELGFFDKAMEQEEEGVSEPNFGSAEQVGSWKQTDEVPVESVVARSKVLQKLREGKTKEAFAGIGRVQFKGQTFRSDALSGDGGYSGILSELVEKFGRGLSKEDFVKQYGNERVVLSMGGDTNNTTVGALAGDGSKHESVAKQSVKESKSVALGDGLYLDRVGMDVNGNHCAWIRQGSNRAMRIQTNGVLPKTHNLRGSMSEADVTDEIKAEIKAHWQKTRGQAGSTVPAKEAAGKFVVWVKENDKWEEQGDGELSQATAERIAKEVRHDCGCRTQVLPAGQQPKSAVQEDVDYVLGSKLPPDLQKKVKAAYVHRFTGEHKPKWAEKPWKDGKPYTVQFKDDEDWLNHTEFPVTKKGALSNRPSMSRSNPTWPENQGKLPESYRGSVVEAWVFTAQKKLVSNRVTKSLHEAWRQYGPGKFNTMVDALVHAMTLDGTCDELGDVQDFGWYGKVTGLTVEELEKTAKEQGEEPLTAEEKTDLAKTVGAIVFENNSGFVEVTYYDDAAKLDEAWAKLESEYEEFMGESEENLEGDTDEAVVAALQQLPPDQQKKFAKLKESLEKRLCGKATKAALLAKEKGDLKEGKNPDKSVKNEAKIQLEIDDTLQGCVDSAIEQVKEALAEYIKDDANLTEPPDLGDLDHNGRIHEIVDGSVPIYTQEIKDIMYLHGDDVNQAFDDAGIGSRDDEGWPLGWEAAAIYCYIDQKVREWYSESAREVFDSLRGEGAGTELAPAGEPGSAPAPETGGQAGSEKSLADESKK